MMSASAVLSLLLEEFWHSLATVEQVKLVRIYHSPKPGECKDDLIAVNLWNGLQKRKNFFKI